MFGLSKIKKSFTGALIAAVGCIAVAITLLYFTLPQRSEQAYKYEEGRPWHYEPIIAPFDFPILLSDEQIEAKRDSLMKSFSPYVKLNQAQGVAMIDSFSANFDRGEFGKLAREYKNHVVMRMQQLYTGGIIASEDYDRLLSGKAPNIRIIEGQSAATYGIEELFTPVSAYEKIVNQHADGLNTAVLVEMKLNRFIHPNVTFDEEKNRSAQQEMLDEVTNTAGMVQVGERIIDRGEVITPEKFSVIRSFYKEQERRQQGMGEGGLIDLGYILVIASIFAASMVYLHLFRKDYTESVRHIILYVILLSAFPLLTYFMLHFQLLNIYMIPMAMAPIFARIFFDSRTATMVLIGESMIAALPVSDPFGFILLQLVMGMVAIYAVREITERAQLFRISVMVMAAGLLFHFFYDLYQGVDLKNIDNGRYFSLIAGGVLLLLSYPLLFVVERVFSFTSNVTLIELANINNPTMQRMSREAQGTFNHSLQVGNLATTVAEAIGANSLLVRTGAYYHDIGKMFNAKYFTENQGSENPHDRLTEEQSAEIIINHVKDGITEAHQMNLPKEIIDFIPTHHGTSLVRYFYVKWKEKHDGQEPPKTMFRYGGPNPQTKEQAILMMCDSLEASSRSLKEYTIEAIDDLVEKIVGMQVAEGYFNEAPITFLDIKTAKEVLKKSLKVMYHTRIAYPEDKTEKKEEPKETPAEE